MHRHHHIIGSVDVPGLVTGHRHAQRVWRGSQRAQRTADRLGVFWRHSRAIAPCDFLHWPGGLAWLAEHAMFGPHQNPASRTARVQPPDR